MKLDKARIEVLNAYKNNTSHNRSMKIVSSLVSQGYLAPIFKNNKWTLEITSKGIESLNAVTFLS